MIIEGENFILLIISRNHIGGVTVVPLRKLFEKTETVGDCIIMLRVKIQIQPLRQFKQPFAPFARGNHAVNRAEDGNDNHGDDENELHRENRLAVKAHAVFLNQKPRREPLQF